MVTNKIIVLLTVVFLAIAGTTFGFAQATASGNIIGVAQDKAGAVLVGAKVTCTSLRTSNVRTATSNNSGEFRFDQLEAGSYSVKVTKEGFASYVQSLELLVGQTASVQASLKPGSASEVIEVTSDVLLIDTTKTDVADQITPTEVVELPMLGRDAATLAYLVPGVKQADSYDPTKNRSAVLSVNGQGGRNVNVTVNGVDNKDNSVGGTVMQLPLEAVEEYNISTQRFSAANGRSEGAAINMITKSGSNNYHGSAFILFRDTSLNADYTAPDGSKSSPAYSRQQFGGSVGGPIVKNKAFGFFAYERQREHTSLSEDTTDFAELSLLTTLGAKPAATIPTPYFDSRYNGRFDYQFNNAQKIYVSYSSQANNSENDQSDGTGDLTNGNFTTNKMQIANVTLNSVFSPTLVNQVTAGYQYWNNVINTTNALPLLYFASGSQFGTNQNIPQQSYQRKWQFKDDLSKTWNAHTFKTGVDYIWEQSLGGYFKFNYPIELFFNVDPSSLGSTPAAVAAALSSTPGLIDEIDYSTGDPTTTVPNGTKQFGLYFQDDWKVNKRLTVSLGVRYDRDFNMVEGNAVATSRTFEELKAAAAYNTSLASFTKKIPQDDTLNFSPRVGFAYDVTGKGTDVVRGGFGLYYGNIFQNIPIFMEQQHNPTVYQGYAIDQNDGQSVPGFATGLENWTYSPANIQTVLNNLPAPSTTLEPGSTGYTIDPNYKNPVTEEFNIGWAHQLNQKSSLTVEYVHVLSLHENKTIDLNPKLPVAGDYTSSYRPLAAAFAAAGVPQLNRVRNQESIGRSRYDGINVSYEQRLSHHFSVKANYSLSWAYGYSAAASAGSYHTYPKDPTIPINPRDFGPSPYDERHHITVAGMVQLPWKMEMSPILQFGTARPYDVKGSTDYIGTGSVATSSAAGAAVLVPVSDQKNYTWEVDTYNNLVNVQGYTATAAKALLRQSYYAGGPLGQTTIAKYDPLRGNAFFQLDLRLAKNVKIGEKVNLQIIAQAFDLTNHANYGNNFQGTVTSGSFKQAISFINPSSQLMARSASGEFGVRLSF